MDFKPRCTNEADKIKRDEIKKSQVLPDRPGLFDPRRAALKEYETTPSQDKAQQSDVRSSSDTSKNVEIPANFEHIGGNTDLARAQIIFLGKTHVAHHHTTLIFDFINAHLNDGDIVLVGGVQAGEELDRFEYLHNSMIRVLNKKNKIYGWDDVNLQTKQFEILSKCLQLGIRFSETHFKDSSVEIKNLCNNYDELTVQRYEKMLETINKITNLFPNKRIYVVSEKYDSLNSMLQKKHKRCIISKIRGSSIGESRTEAR